MEHRRLLAVSSSAQPLPERVRIVAFLACPPECSIMRIIPVVAAVAVGRRSHLRGIGIPVARVTLQGLMRTRQRVAGLLVMIETPMRPTVGVVTARAVGAEPADVMGIGMAARARARCILERLGRGGNSSQGTTACKPMSGNRVRSWSKATFLSPARLLVTLLAVAARAGPMRIILAMARDARHGELVTIEVSACGIARTRASRGRRAGETWSPYRG